MKALVFITICLLSITVVFAQKQEKIEVPAAVKTTFATKFPKAQDVKWGIEKKGEFEAEFKLNGVETSTVLDEKGNLLETETEIKESELPQSVKKSIAKDFPGFKMDEFNKVTDSKGKVTYEVEVKKDNEKVEAIYDSAGKLIKKEKEDNKEKDND